MDSPPPPRKKKTKSELLRASTLHEYVEAHARPNGHGWRGFFRSNLFASLVIFLLSQSVIIAGLAISFYYRTSTMSEWKGETIATLKRMDEWGTTHGHFADERQDKELTDLEVRMKKSEEEGRQWEVIKTEHRRLTEDVEDLRHGKK